MTTARTFGTLYHQTASKRAAALFNDLATYRFCIGVAAFDYFDVFDFLERSNLAKYDYAAIVLGIMVIYFLKWKTVDVSIAPTIFLLVFVVTGFAFAIRFFIFDERNISIALFIPKNSIMRTANTAECAPAKTLLGRNQLGHAFNYSAA